ncbi:MAG: hypothetical protein NTW86_12905 [Candidatus Sumerlaeota bacterium]|nr:hypothetical protein [Candidatus Sumerlaeota bacterium]
MKRSLTFFLLPVICSAQLIDLASSPHAKVRGAPVSAVKIDPGFWTPRMAANVERSLPALLRLMEENSWIDNFRRLGAGKPVPR